MLNVEQESGVKTQYENGAGAAKTREQTLLVKPD